MSTAPDKELDLYRPTVAEIDLDAFSRNLDSIRKRIPRTSKLVAVLKADGYGHGAVELARRSTRKAAMIAVALLEEALELRAARIRLPILVLGPLTPSQLPLATANDLDLGIVGPETLASACEYARQSGDLVRIHLKLDTGMGRMGLTDSDLAAAASMLQSAPSIRLQAIYTHFANASDPDDPLTDDQLQRFTEMNATLKRLGIEAPLHHSANSAAIVRGIVTPGDYVRAGIVMYGIESLDRGPSRLEPLMTWRTRIARLKELPAGHAVGYGATFRTSRPSLIATLPVGYADGFSRLLSNNAEVLVRGRRAPVVGRVSMDLVTVDVTEIGGVSAGDEVVLIGAQGGERITAEEMAARIGTIGYEVLCAVGARVPRRYVTKDKSFVRSKFQKVLSRYQ